jgi:hypothetical protein
VLTAAAAEVEFNVVEVVVKFVEVVVNPSQTAYILAPIPLST